MKKAKDIRVRRLLILSPENDDFLDKIKASVKGSSYVTFQGMFNVLLKELSEKYPTKEALFAYFENNSKDCYNMTKRLKDLYSLGPV